MSHEDSDVGSGNAEPSRGGSDARADVSASDQSPDATADRRVEVTVEGGERVVRTYRTSRDGKVFTVEHRLPDALTHYYAGRQPGEPIPLYTGDFEFAGDQRHLRWRGGVSLHWHPNPTVVAAGIRDFNDPADLDGFDGRGGWVPVPSLVLPDPAAPPEAPGGPSVAPTLGPGGGEQIARRDVQQEVGSRAGLERVTFLVPNGWSIWHGGNICDPGEPEVFWPGRLVATVGDWRITLDRRREADERFMRALRDEGQSGVTHVGQVERADGKPFHGDDAWPVLRALRLALSLAMGRAVALLLPVGWRGSQATWARWASDRIDGVRPSGSFLDLHKGHAQLRELIERVIAYCDTDARLDVLQYATSYYITATYDVDVELRVALPVSGMQLLAYNRFVEERGSHSNKTWASVGTTEDELRLLLDDCKIPTGLPPLFTHLQKVSAAAFDPAQHPSPRDALGCAMLMRNKVIHPTKGTPAKWDAFQWWEAGAFATDALLLSILQTVGYTGEHRSPLSADVWAGETDTVPWAAAGGSAP